MQFNRKTSIVSKQFREASISPAAVSCRCGRTFALRFMYRCLYCGEYYCLRCAEVHFGMSREQYKKVSLEGKQ